MVTRKLTEDVEERLRSEFHVLPGGGSLGLTADEIAARIGGADAVCPTVADRIDGKLLTLAAGRLRLVANFGVGYNNVDTAVARELGIIVTNTPDVLTESTADLAMTLLLMAARRAGEGERLCRAGRWTGWEPRQLLGREVSGKTLGLVGFGRIARAVARRAHDGFGMRIFIHSHSRVDEASLQRYDARQRNDLRELLAASDFVSLHCPSTPETRHLIDGGALGGMRRKAILVNTARGDVVDEPALARALADGTIAGAGLDVYEREPAIDPGLLVLENVVLLPHLGSATQETRSAMGHRMIDNLVDFFAGREPVDRVV
jgi:lactate dehydrogenase-like 2-hydroxyacid dehydrogenase